MPDKNSSEEQLIKKIKELEEKLAASHNAMFSYFYAILDLLEEKKIISKKEFNAHLPKSRRKLKKIEEAMEFIKLMKQLKKDK